MKIFFSSENSYKNFINILCVIYPNCKQPNCLSIKEQIEQLIDATIWMEFHKHHIKWKKPDIKDTYDSFWMKFKKRQNESTVIEIIIGPHFLSGEGSIGKWHLGIFGWNGNVLHLSLDGGSMGVYTSKHSCNCVKLEFLTMCTLYLSKRMK